MKETEETWVWSLGQEDPLERAQQSTPIFLPGEFHGLNTLAVAHRVAKSQTRLKQLTHICHEGMGLDAMILVFWMLRFKWAFSLSSFTLIKRLFSSSSLSAIRVVFYLQFSSVAQSCLTLQAHGLQHTRLPCPSPTPGAYSNSCPLRRWYHPTISSSVIPFSSHLQSFPASGSFSVSLFFASGGQSTGVWASALVLPMNIQDWFPLGWTGWISLQSKGLSRIFSNTTVQKHQFFCAQLSL